MKEEEFIKLLEGDERIESMDLKSIKSTFEKVSRISSLASRGQLLIVPRHYIAPLPSDQECERRTSSSGKETTNHD